MTEEIAEDWEPLVGRFILKCGNIELRLLQLYWNMRINALPYDDTIKTKGLVAKANYIRNLLDHKKLTLTEDTKTRIRKIISKTMNLADTRNLVAHNPLFLDFYSMGNGDFKHVSKIQSLRNNERHVSKEKLINEIEKAKDLEEEYYKLVDKSGMEASNRLNNGN